MKVNDNFDFDLLECQYYDICKYFNPTNCHYSTPCKTNMTYDGTNVGIPIRELFRKGLESYVTKENISTQLELLEDDERDE